MSYPKPQQREGFPPISCAAWREAVPLPWVWHPVGKMRVRQLSLRQLWGVGAKQMQAWKTDMGKNTPR